MTSEHPSPGARITLALCTILHAMTHAYMAILIPLYLLMRDDLHLPGVKSAALIVSISGIVYFLFSYPAGILADHFNRKFLLGIGLLGNALAFIAMGLTHQYWLLVVLGMLAGLFGSLFHPSVNALIPAHFPRNPGMAVGILGIGSGIGFFLGSQYSGWRAETVVAPWGGMSPWQVPCVELGLLGVGIALLFFLLGREVAHAAAARPRIPMGKGMRRRVLAIALILGCRDFAGVATSSLISIYLQKAQGYDAKQTGWVLGAMGLISVFATPLAIWITPGQRRLGGLAAAVIAGGIVLTAVPHLALAWLLPALAIFQVFHLSSYAMGEVALVELVAPAVRGRVIGLFLTVSGTLGAAAPWAIGWWTDLLGARALRQQGYIIPFASLGLLMILASLSIRLMKRLGEMHPLPEAATAATLAAEPHL